MAITRDPEGMETATLSDFVDFTDRQVLEIGCGDGRLTWRYAHEAAHVTAIDPCNSDISTALANRPTELIERVHFEATPFEPFASSLPRSTRFDIALLSWSL